MNTVYNKRCGLFLGFHGCDVSVRDILLNNPQEVHISSNRYDWLGSGFYIWENNYERALQWAQNNKNISNPSVIGVTYELGNCLDLMDSDSINVLREAYLSLTNSAVATGFALPQNKDLSHDAHHDKLLRNLDCAVINHATHKTDAQYRQDLQLQGYSSIEPYDTVRGCFTEGGKLFDTEIFERTHIQVCIRNLNCIKGFFMPRESVVFP